MALRSKGSMSTSRRSQFWRNNGSARNSVGRKSSSRTLATDLLVSKSAWTAETLTIGKFTQEQTLLRHKQDTISGSPENGLIGTQIGRQTSVLTLMWANHWKGHGTGAALSRRNTLRNALRARRMHDPSLLACKSLFFRAVDTWVSIVSGPLAALWCTFGHVWALLDTWPLRLLAEHGGGYLRSDVRTLGPIYVDPSQNCALVFGFFILDI